ncbi:hypothetical protein SAMD00019534_061710 [Acytostelium subglobosum LB1]|uniref:hypothetical protein n=1 Tax=Acytostelium subglobosum LB1 TaxID=1410327 RepID=UPI0006451811|nr:hypothetical protein SAMD00019534_061710 [Acytostelium subglobosum LB1]GAM22996.1 hypothetical protein SAMD00019534_061710 [Acytostelium subglobosum LB1]|eukprot:XP_012754223.1 hypothetical protein SAMD00019534_061710 [Acytostelium subglobosum LB1]
MVRKASTTTTKVTIPPKTQESKKRKNEDDIVHQPVKKLVTSGKSPICALFEKYQDPADKSIIGPDGITSFCHDLGLAPDSIQVLILAWTMNAKKMGYFTYDEFKVGFEQLRCNDLPNLKRTLQTMTHQIKLDPIKFSELYKFSFRFASEIESKKSVDLQIAAEMLELVLPDGPHTKSFIKFLRNTKSYKVINMDQWVCFLEFSKTVKGDLSNYDESEAWPLLIDDFVEFTSNDGRK